MACRSVNYVNLFLSEESKMNAFLAYFAETSGDGREALFKMIFMIRKRSPLDEPQWSDRLTLKILLTVLCAIIGAIVALYVFGVI